MDLPGRQLRDAARLAAQSAVAAAGMFTLMQTLGMTEKLIGILSAVLVVQPSVGGTLGTARQRFEATVVGSVIGAVCLALLPGGYGTTAALALSMLVLNAVAAFRPGWRYGVVAAVALALGSEEQVLRTAIDRGLAISVGALVGALVASLLWPDTAGKRLTRHLRGAYRAIANRIGLAIEDALSEPGNEEKHKRARQRYHHLITQAREAADSMRLGDRPAAKKRIELTERLYNSVLIVNRVAGKRKDRGAEHAPLADQVKNIRTQACEIVDDMATGKSIEQERLQELQRLLDSAVEAAQPSPDSRAERIRIDAMLFGLEELVSALIRLREQDCGA